MDLLEGTQSFFLEWTKNCTESWWGSGLLFCVLLVLFVQILLNNHWRKWIYLHLKYIALTVFVLGMVVYGFGFNFLGSEKNVTVLFLRSLLSSLEMFASGSALKLVNPDLQRCHVYMLVFMLVHFMAVCVSAVFLIRLFGYKFHSWIYLYWLRLFKSVSSLKGKELYVMMGINNNSVVLAESIRKELNDRAMIVFVTFPNRKHETFVTRFSLSRFFYYSNENVDDYMERIEDADIILASASQAFEVSEINGVPTVADFYARLGLKSLWVLLNKFYKAGNPVKLFFLSDDENRNLKEVILYKHLYASETEEEQAKTANMQLYCHARKNRFNSNLLLASGLSYKVHLIDSSSLAVGQLKMNPKHYPVAYVKRDTERGVVSSSFHAMVIGFGETGRDAFRFLYESAAFVGEEGKKQQNRFYIVDEQMEEQRTDFLLSAPALSVNDEIVWKKLSTHSVAFWKEMESLIGVLNYIVVAVEDDDEAKNLVSDLCHFASRHRTNLDRFGIYVRIRDKMCNSLLESFKNFVNPLSEKICVFGSVESVFNYKYLFTESEEVKAMTFYRSYLENSNRNEENLIVRQWVDEMLDRLDEKELWLQRRQFNAPVEENGKVILRSRQSLQEHIKVWYQEQQDISNVCHVMTKWALAGALDEQMQLDRERRGAMRLLVEKIEHQGKEVLTAEERVLFTHLSDVEHLRWLAKMELLGFVPAKGEASGFLLNMEHKCMVDCEELKERFAYTIPYDEMVVKLSFK